LILENLEKILKFLVRDFDSSVGKKLVRKNIFKSI